MSWNKKRLGDFAPFVYGKGLPKEKRIAGNVPVYGSNGVVGFHNQPLLNEPAVIIGRKGSVGEIHLTAGPSWPIDTTFYAESNDEADLDFLFYLLQTLPLKSNSDSAVPGLSRDYAHSLEVFVPEKPMQVCIGSILKSIDLKIQSNRSVSETLEEVAQTIFKSWFIDFDPVKAKMAGEKPVGIDDATAALFPDSMDNSELGPIPKGWEVVTIGDVLVKQKPGKLYDQKTSSQSGLIPVLDQGRSGVVGYHNEAPGYFATPDNPVVVFANHTCSLRFIAFPFSVIQNVFPILGNELSVYWLYFALQGKQEFDSYKGHWPDLVIKPVVRPTQIVSKAFENLTSPLMKMVWNLEKENQGLVELRDSLLPRLISGELQIPDEILVS